MPEPGLDGIQSQASPFQAGRIDLPQESVELLSTIKQMNKNVFSTFGDAMRTHEAYTWSRREETPVGSTLEQLIHFGIERPKYSSDVFGVLLKVCPSYYVLAAALLSRHYAV